MAKLTYFSLSLSVSLSAAFMYNAFDKWRLDLWLVALKSSSRSGHCPFGFFTFAFAGELLSLLLATGFAFDYPFCFCFIVDRGRHSMWIYFRSAARLCPTYRLLDRFISRPSFLLLLPVVAYFPKNVKSIYKWHLSSDSSKWTLCQNVCFFF